MNILIILLLFAILAIIIYVAVIVSQPIKDNFTPNKNKIVAFMPNFEPGSFSYKGIQYGKPENYTHLIIAFLTPYHYYMGKDESMGCSTLCNLSTGSYYTGMDNVTAAQITQTIISNLKSKNPNLNILFSLGGWGFDNFKCNFECSDNIDPLQFFYKNYKGDPYNVGNCKSTNNDIYPSNFCVQTGAKNVAQKLVELVNQFGIQGIDLDFEATHIYNDPQNPQRQQYLDFYRGLVINLKQLKSDIIISVSPQVPYVLEKTAFPNAYQFHQEWLTPDIVDKIDIINVQFYNNPPDDTDINSDPNILITNYSLIADKYGSDKVTFGMCTAREDGGVCTKCTFNTLQGSILNNNCTDPSRRYNNIIVPLYNKYKENFGGIMFWNTAGDVNGEFTNPFYSLFYSQSPPTPTTPSPTPMTPSPTPITPSPTPITPSPTPITPSPTPMTPSPTPITPSPTPMTPSPTPMTPSPTPMTPIPVQTCIPLYEECTNDSNCCLGSKCVKQNNYYSQCIVDLNANCIQPYQPCANTNKECCNNFTCYSDPYYSQCVPKT
jgi:hypothetical protein